MKRNNRKGFTTVELVIVIAVIAILATALIPTFGGLIDKANSTSNDQAANNIYKQYIIESYQNADKTYYIQVEDGVYYFVDGGNLVLTALTATKECNVAIVKLVDGEIDDTTKTADHLGLTDGKGTCTTCGKTFE